MTKASIFRAKLLEFKAKTAISNMHQFLLLITLTTLLLNRVLSCSCPRTDFRADYYGSIKRGTPFARAKVISSRRRIRGANKPFSNEKEIFYKLHVTYVFTNCRPRRSYIAFAVTLAESALCGVPLEVGATYLLPLKIGARKVTELFLCGGNVLLRSPKRKGVTTLSTENRRFLLTRRFCCRGRCKCIFGRPRRFFFGLCLGTTCRLAKKPCAEATRCVTNRCDGCNSEWFTKDRNPACLPNFGEEIVVPEL